MSEIVLEAKEISKRFGVSPVVEGVSLAVAREEIVTLIGPNGSGKTTLLKLLLGLIQPDSGTVTRTPGLHIGYMPQKLTIDPVLPITAAWFLTMHSHRHMPQAEEIQAVCREVGVEHVLARRLQDLSGGELQRLMLARALLCHPELLVLDEPVQGVDVNGQAALYELITRVSRVRRCAVLMVSHDLHLVMSGTDKVICLNHHICCVGHPRDIQGDPAFSALFGSHVAAYTHHHTHSHEHTP